jgi:hypothetical protein
VAAAVLAFVLVQASCIAIALAWLVLSMWARGHDSAGGLIGFALALVLAYSVLVVVLMRATTRGLYRRYL